MTSAAPDPLPRFVFKIVPSAPPEPLPSPFPLSELDQKDGFVHLSVGSQIPITAGLFFSDHKELWILKIKLAPFQEKINWDVPGCPHLYGNFGAADVDTAKRFQRAEGEEWKDALKADAAWLE